MCTNIVEAEGHAVLRGRNFRHFFCTCDFDATNTVVCKFV